MLTSYPSIISMPHVKPVYKTKFYSGGFFQIVFTLNKWNHFLIIFFSFSDDAPKDCWRFDEKDGEFVYQKELRQSQFGHEHNQMAMYHGNPLAIGSCWGLEVEMLDRHDEEWKRLSDFPNPGFFQ